MNIKKTLKYILLAVPLLLITKCGIESAIYNSNKKPEMNPSPTHKMMVHGKFPFEDDVKFDMAVLYLTTNPECDTNNWLAGIRFPQRFMKSFPTTVKDGMFESDIYLDSYLPGICGWQAYGVSIVPQTKEDHLSTPNKGISDNEEHLSKGISISNAHIGVIAYEAFHEQGQTLDVECFRKNKILWKGLPKEMILTRLYCTYLGEISRPVPDSGSKPKANISSSQKEVEINFIDKGWKE